jgi:bifunctional non-homologous end joining protein LigD
LFQRGEPRFIACDLLWLEGEDSRYQPLIDRKQRLRSVVPAIGGQLLYCDHVEHDGEALFRLACEQDLEGIVGKNKRSPYLLEQGNWLKIRNRNTPNGRDGKKLFDRERGGDPDFGV